MVKKIELDGRKLLTKEQAHPCLKQALDLPEYYGNNLDALYDCLTELSGVTIVLHNAQAMRESEYGKRVLTVLEDAARENPGLGLAYDGHYTVRFATEADGPALLAVYAQYIDTSITFEYTLPTAEEFTGRIRDISRVYPYLVLERDGVPVGYAYAHRSREREAYDWVAELSIYLDRSATGQGLGKRLYSLLMDLLAMQGLKTAMGCVTVPNAASEALHAALGFTRVGLSPCAGYKAGAWRDVSWFEKALGPYDVPPAPLLPISAVDAVAVAERMARF